MVSLPWRRQVSESSKDTFNNRKKNIFSSYWLWSVTMSERNNTDRGHSLAKWQEEHNYIVTLLPGLTVKDVNVLQ